MEETLDLWPPLPIVIAARPDRNWDVYNIIVALEHTDRICRLDIDSFPSSELEEVLEVMHQPFPELTSLELRLHPRSADETALVDPDSFLGGSAPRLELLFLRGISFPGLPKLLLSATHLVCLTLSEIPHSGYISPEAMVTGLAALTRLETLFVKFNSPRSRPRPKSRRPSPPTRTLLPVLAILVFQGVSQYLEDLVARIDAPLLNMLQIHFFHQPIFSTPQLAQFISRTPNFEASNEARLVFASWEVRITLPQINDGTIKLIIMCEELDVQLMSLEQVCNSSFPQAFIPAVEHLYILEDELDVPDVFLGDDIENSHWLELLRPFTAVRDLYMVYEIATFISPALQELVGERVTEMLPALRTLFLEEPLISGSAIVQFIAARQLACYPIVISSWEREEDEPSGLDLWP
jgi:hypothetical protein